MAKDEVKLEDKKEEEIKETPLEESTLVEDQVEEESPVVGATMRCWNCRNHDNRSRNRLNKDGVCPKCGFDIKLTYNGQIEADRQAQRIELARKALEV